MLEGLIGDKIECYIQNFDTLHVGGVEYDGPKLYVITQRKDGTSTSVYMGREKVEELATYLMYWLHETKDAE